MPISALKSKQKARTQCCDIPDCDLAGEYKAPRSREQLREYHYFCLKHVREYNANWNFFAGMSDADTLDYIKNDMTGHRPTRPLSGEGKPGGDNILFSAFFDSFDRGFHFEEMLIKPEPVMTAERASAYDPAIREACKILGVKCPPEPDEMKKSYKILVKDLHPDTSENHTPEKEARFREVVKAYRDLIKVFKG